MQTDIETCSGKSQLDELFESLKDENLSDNEVNKILKDVQKGIEDGYSEYIRLQLRGGSKEEIDEIISDCMLFIYNDRSNPNFNYTQSRIKNYIQRSKYNALANKYCAKPSSFYMCMKIEDASENYGIPIDIDYAVMFSWICDMTLAQVRNYIPQVIRNKKMRSQNFYGVGSYR